MSSQTKAPAVTLNNKDTDWAANKGWNGSTYMQAGHLNFPSRILIIKTIPLTLIGTIQTGQQDTEEQ